MTETKAFSSEETKIMERNGVTKGCAWNRIKRLGWSRERAITKPPIKKRLKIVEDEEKAILKLESITTPEDAYQRFLESRVDKSHLEKYPQSVNPSDYYNYLKSKVTWS
ncbi:hypothetical protein [Staphylococcus pseudintermedius]|uniref:hypothetical protein n=1 Tax=Staphylococcus pseudintermedius TaxID=283734 RepID=UPI00037B1E9F|nr:hypothetical protein [Staphylococcus pseudintermedius]ANS89898.1 hypothetical protein A6M57_7910 [Staphylococcus pseudintermedius]MDA3098143.1 hypothetical protein [Staphylococcus pseudintermedius]MDA3106385.1 hypothetical protein [Staphylococcus pseudintermedius]MDE9864688.1 hypothetical protein [Staphylococcus pseudintermedius]MDE9992324.1 hypothetical protein [Staphylococcus pseudintermedius]